MLDVIDSWLRLAATRLHAEAPALTALDQAIGDGDHGTNMDRGFGAIVAMLDAGPPDGEGDVALAAARLRTAGRTLISTVGGAAGPLYGTALMRAGGAVAAADGDGQGGRDALLAGLDAAIGGIAGLGKAIPGEKTMLDALTPALEAGRTAVAAGADHRRRLRGDGRCRRGWSGRHHPDAGDQGSRVVPRRAIHRTPGSGGHVGGAAAARPVRRRRRPVVRRRRMPARVDPASTASPGVLVGRPGSPGLGIGRALTVAPAPPACRDRIG